MSSAVTRPIAGARAIGRPRSSQPRSDCANRTNSAGHIPPLPALLAFPHSLWNVPVVDRLCAQYEARFDAVLVIVCIRRTPAEPDKEARS